MKKKIIITVISLIIISTLFIILFPVIKNTRYEKRLLDKIYNNTNYTDIVCLNKDNNYYIIKTKNNVIVLDLNYEEIVLIDLNNIIESDLELVYPRNNLYYEEKIRENGKIIYKFYNVETFELEYETSLGGM